MCLPPHGVPPERRRRGCDRARRMGFSGRRARLGGIRKDRPAWWACTRQPRPPGGHHGHGLGTHRFDGRAAARGAGPVRRCRCRPAGQRRGALRGDRGAQGSRAHDRRYGGTRVRRHSRRLCRGVDRRSPDLVPRSRELLRRDVADRREAAYGRRRRGLADAARRVLPRRLPAHDRAVARVLRPSAHRGRRPVAAGERTARGAGRGRRLAGACAR